ncbi:alpha/beta hydrolase [Aminobacter niigataensis]|uniref:Esterase/lipase superfamily enzyme n=1 Tax=Aminobacter niigataensis TaxID=83265 RepID=A0ABR6L5W2_9HYPH|nr:alpha/beta fold hydrolase [Aminobacter niigataensis]MBB4651405.1 esterase/lipase superfamily enzyme [Aminobacter niigataensis]CAI2931988.1 Alpha/beta hydrolase family protein [Aminobacter niigataensis]
MIKLRFLTFFLVLVVLSGCGGRAVLGLGDGKEGESAAVVPIYVSTMRARSDNLALPYSAERAKSLNFAKFEIGIPATHVAGEVESASRAPSPVRNFVARSFQPFDEKAQFVAALDADLMRRPPEEREVFIFVHGYNNNFADSIFRNAQIVHDYKIKAVALHYAWPSGGSLPLYVYDRDSAAYSRDGLADTIEIAARSQAKRVVLVGHSMGSYVVMEALRSLSLSGRDKYISRINDLVLAAPDIDIDVFQSQLRDIDKLPNPFMILVSTRDKALNLSGGLTGGHPRVGSGADVAALQAENITVLDTSNLDGGSHGVFASSPTLMALMAKGGLTNDITDRGEGAPAETILADGTSVIQGAASLVIYLPARLLGVPNGGLTR